MARYIAFWPVTWNGHIAMRVELYDCHQGIYLRGDTRSVHDGGSNGASHCEHKKIRKPEILHPKKYLASKFSPQKIHDLNTLILIYSIRQTLRPKRIRDRSLDPKKYREFKFSTPQKYVGPSPSCILRVSPWGINRVFPFSIKNSRNFCIQVIPC